MVNVVGEQGNLRAASAAFENVSVHGSVDWASWRAVTNGNLAQQSSMDIRAASALVVNFLQCLSQPSPRLREACSV